MASISVSKEKVKTIAELSKDRASEKNYQQAIKERPKYEEKVGGSAEYASKVNTWLNKYKKDINTPERYKETQEYINKQNQTLKGKTYTGKDIKALAQRTDVYNVEYYQDGTVKSIKQKPTTYESRRETGKKTTGKSIDPSISTQNYIGYEIEFRPDGTIKSEILRKDDVIERQVSVDDDSRWKRDERKRTVYDDLAIYYDNKGNPEKIIDNERDLVVKKSDKGNKLYQYEIVDRSTKDLKTGTEIFKPKQDTKKGLFQYQRDNIKNQNKLLLQQQQIKNQKEKLNFGLTANEIKVLYKKNPKLLKKVITDTTAREKGKLTQSQSMFYDIKSKQPKKPLTTTQALKVSGLTTNEIKELKQKNPKLLKKVVADIKKREEGKYVQSEINFYQTKAKQQFTGNLDIAESLLKKQEARKQLIKESDTGKVNYIDTKTGQPIPAPIWKQDISFDKKLIKQGSALITQGEKELKEKTEKLLKGEKTNIIGISNINAKVFAGTIEKSTGQIFSLVKGVPGFVANTVVPFAQSEIKDVEGIFTNTKIGYPGFTTPSNPFTRTVDYTDKKLKQIEKTTDNVVAATVVTGTLLATSGIEYGKKDFFQTGGAGLSSRLAGELALNYGITKTLQAGGSILGKIGTKIDDAKIAKVAAKEGQIVTQKTAKDIAKLKNVDIKLGQISEFERVAAGSVDDFGKVRVDEQLFLKKTPVTDGVDLSKVKTPKQVILSGEEVTVGKLNILSKSDDTSAIIKSSPSVTETKKVYKIYDAKKLNQALSKESVGQQFWDDAGLSYSLREKPGGILYSQTKIGTKDVDVPTIYATYSKGKVIGSNAGYTTKEGLKLGFKTLKIGKTEIGLPLKRFYSANVPAKGGREAIIYTLEGVTKRPVKVASQFRKFATSKSVLGQAVAEGYVKVPTKLGNIEVMTKSWLDKTQKVTGFKDIVGPEKQSEGIILTNQGGISQILKDPTIKVNLRFTKQKTEQVKEKIKPQPDKVFYDVSGDTAYEPFIVGEGTQTPTPSREAFKEGIIPDNIFDGKQKPTKDFGVYIKPTQDEELGSLRENINIGDIGTRYNTDRISEFEKKFEPTTKITPTIDFDIISDTSSKTESKSAVKSKISQIYDTKYKLDNIYDFRFEPKNEIPEEEKPIPKKPKFSFGLENKFK